MVDKVNTVGLGLKYNGLMAGRLDLLGDLLGIASEVSQRLPLPDCVTTRDQQRLDPIGRHAGTKDDDFALGLDSAQRRHRVRTIGALGDSLLVAGTIKNDRAGRQRGGEK